jgi:hypothetical protein
MKRKRLIIGILIFLTLGFCLYSRYLLGPRDIVDIGGKSRPWLYLSHSGTIPWSEDLTVYSDGRVRVNLFEPRENGYVGVFEFKLSEDRYRNLRKTVRNAFDKTIFPTSNYPKVQDDEWVKIELRENNKTRSIHKMRDSWFYEGSIRQLFDLTTCKQYKKSAINAGILSELISEATNHPLRAISLKVSLNKKTFRTGEKIKPVIIIKNVGCETLLLPSLPGKALTMGEISVTLNSNPADFAIKDKIQLAEGRDGEDLITLKPQAEWKIELPRAFIAPPPGEYWIISRYISLPGNKASDTESLKEEIIRSADVSDIVKIKVQ